MKIYPAFDLADDPNHISFITSVEQLLEELLPEKVLEHRHNPELFFKHLLEILPLICGAQLEKRGECF